jgi:hypothetical protein
MRFERVGRVIARDGHELAYVALDDASVRGFPTQHAVFPLTEAAARTWDATIVPGAGFPDPVIRRFAELREPKFGLRIQMVLKDQSRRAAFANVNASFAPNLVVFNNRHWPPGSYREFRADQFHYLIGAVDTCAMEPAAKQRARDGRFVIGAQLTKNPRPLVEALRLLPAAFVVRFFGHDRAKIVSELAPLVEAGRVELCGYLFDQELAAYFRGLDVVVSTEVNAGWANVVAEGMASGTPVVTTPAGTLDIARDGDTALVVAEPTPELLAAALRRLQEEPDTAARLAANARRHIEAYNWPVYAASLLALIRDQRKVQT